MVNADGIHHIGITVADRDRSIDFWSRFLEVEPRWRRRLDGVYLGGVTGYPGVHIDAAIIDLPGGAVLEILEYLDVDRSPNPPDTANPGNMHLCLGTNDIDGVWQKAVDAGATPISPGPVLVSEGPNAGAKAAYLRDPDGITLELFQAPH